MRKLTRSESFPGSIQRFRAAMQRLMDQVGQEGWYSSNRRRLVFGEYPYMQSNYYVPAKPDDPFLGTFSAFDWDSEFDETANKTPIRRPLTRASWHVLLWRKSGMRPESHPTKGLYSAGIEAYEEADDRTSVLFLDGYDPHTRLVPRLQIGPVFAEFCEWVIQEVWSVRTSEPTPTQNLEASVGEWETPRDLDSLSLRLAKGEENLRLIEERLSEYVLETDKPLSLIKEHRQKQKLVDELRQQLAECSADGETGISPFGSSEPGPSATDDTGLAEVNAGEGDTLAPAQKDAGIRSDLRDDAARDIEALRRQIDPAWDINPLEVNCSVDECTDIIRRASDYFELKEGRFFPQLSLRNQSLTLAQFDIIHRGGGRSGSIGEVEVFKTGTGCRMQFWLLEKEAINVYRGVYRVICNMLRIGDLLVGYISTTGELVTDSPPAESGTGEGGEAVSANDIIRRVDEMHTDLKQGQAIIYRKIGAENQATSEAILKEIREQRFEQGEMQRMLDAIRRALKHIRETGLPVADPAIEKTLADVYQAVNSDLSLRQQLEFSIPIVPFLLEYRVGLDAGVDLEAVWKEWVERIRRGRSE